MHNQAEANLSALIESTEDLIWSVDLDYGLLTFNKAFQRHVERNFGARAAIGKRPHDLLPPAKAAIWPPLFERVLSRGAFRAELPFAEGRTLELAFNPIVVDGKTTGISVFGKDITERRRAATALAESETRFRTFFEESSSVMLLVDPLSGEIVSANRAASAFYGYPLERLVGMNISQVDTLSPEDLALDRQRALSKERGVFSYRSRLASGEEREIEVYSSPMVVDGRPLLYGIIHDVSDRRRAEDALRESEESLRESQRIAGLGSYVLDVPTGVWTSSEVLDSIFGIGPAYERTVEGWIALVHPDDRAMMTAYFAEEVVGKGQAFDKEYRIIRQTDREVRWVHGIGSLLFDAPGKLLKMHGIIQDITERKQAETRLRESEERYRSTFEQAAVGIVHTAFDGSFLRCNARFAEILGYNAEELPGHTLWQVTLPEDHATSVRTLEQISNGTAATVVVEKRYVRKDRSLTWAKITISAQRDAEGRPLHSIALVEDINDRKTAEERLTAAQEALRISEERHRLAFQTSANAVSIVRLDDGMYLDVSEAFLEITGFKREEVIGRTVRELNLFAGPGDLQDLAESLRRNSVFRGEVMLRKKSGAIFWGLMSASAFEHDGVSCALSVTQDISEAKAAEQRLAAATEALRLSEERYRTAFETSLDAIYISRAHDGMFIDCNKAFFDFMGYKREEVIGKTALELDIWADHRDRQRLVEILRQNPSCRDFKAQFRRKNGEASWGLMSASIIELDGVPCILSMTRDISEAKAAEERLATTAEALRVSEERYRTAFQTSLDAININRLHDGTFIECNKAFLDITGYGREEVIGKTSLELKIWVDPHDRQRLFEMLRQDSSCRDFEAQFRKKNGEVCLGLMSASLIELDGVACILCMTRDISEARAAEDRIRNLAFYDPLTGLPNRRLLLERLREALTSSVSSRRRQALLLVNLDNFKMLNETIGHQTGDLLLQEAARRLVLGFGEAGTVARLGGDEFVVTLDNLSATAEEAAAQAKSAAENILNAIGQPYLLAGRTCRSTASIGITVFGDGPETAEEILQKADIALDQARTAGRNTIHFFAPALQAAVNARAALEDDLGLAMKTNQFALYYQPQVNRDQLIGAEALIRWNHTRRGLLLPREFIPVAEETGLILPLGDWVLETACKQIAAWTDRAANGHIVVAVNISARQFRQPDFVQRVLDALDRTGANPRNLDLELTESMLAENIEEVIAKMADLKAHGVRFSLDDFGTGYSSLAYLKRLPLDVLKIDRSFVRDILVDSGSGAIAQTILSLSKAMGLPVIAEGVETEEQREYLASLGCHSFQGYLFSHPLPLAEFERLWLNSAESPAPILQ